MVFVCCSRNTLRAFTPVTLKKFLFTICRKNLNIYIYIYKLACCIFPTYSLNIKNSTVLSNALCRTVAYPMHIKKKKTPLSPIWQLPYTLNMFYMQHLKSVTSFLLRWSTVQPASLLPLLRSSFGVHPASHAHHLTKWDRWDGDVCVTDPSWGEKKKTNKQT